MHLALLFEQAERGVVPGDARQRGETQAENAYLHVKWFKKGSGHVLFKRPDLVEKMNGILTKHYPHALASEVR